jgi:hypothetical protein
MKYVFSSILSLEKWVGAITIQQAKKSVKLQRKNSQNWINIYVLPFKAMKIMASYYFSFI